MPIRTGIDLTSISRIEQLLENYPQHFKQRFFSETEREYCDSQGWPAQSYAGIWAAKESVFKVLGVGRHWRKIRLDHASTGRPILKIDSRIFTHPEVQIPRSADWDCSIAHDKDFAVATAVCHWTTEHLLAADF